MAGNFLIKNGNGNTVTLQNPDTNTTDVVVDTSNIMPKNLSSETEKTTPVDTDLFGVNDSTNGFSLKKLSWANLKQTFFNSLGLLTAFATTKTSPISADFLILSDTEDNYSTKKTTIENILNKFSLGWGQTRQDVTASRSAGVTYTNNTGKPILIEISFANLSSLSYAEIRKGTDLVATVRPGAGPASIPYVTILNNLDTITVTLISSATISSWFELR